MTKRAKYIGPYEEVIVQDSAQGSHSEGWIVKNGAWLPDDAPARVRDELLQDSEAWVEVKQSDQKKESDG